jgi:trans-2,3-dihydro-3-hydroxyanthranilate isomerase
VRIFTPGAEVPFAGHPTVGAAFVLAASGAVPLTGAITRIVLEENVGPVPVAIFARAGQPVGAQLTAARLPEFGPPPPPITALAEMLSLSPQDLRDDAFSPQAASCGLPFLIVPLQNRDALARARLRREVWERVLAGAWAPWPYLICFDPELPTSHVRARMFAPDVGVEEDPATGSAAAALAGYLGVRDTATDGTLRWVVEQGFEMGRPSILEVEADKQNGAISAVRVGGGCVLVSEGTITI